MLSKRFVVLTSNFYRSCASFHLLYSISIIQSLLHTLCNRGGLAKFFGPDTISINRPIYPRKRKSVDKNIDNTCKRLINPQFKCEFFHAYIANFSMFKM